VRDSCRASATSAACCSPARVATSRRYSHAHQLRRGHGGNRRHGIPDGGRCHGARAGAAGSQVWLVWKRFSRRLRLFSRTRNNRPCWNRARNFFHLPQTISRSISARASHIAGLDRTRNLTRRVTAIQQPTSARLEITVELFPARGANSSCSTLPGALGRPGPAQHPACFRERFRLLLRRQFPEWKLAELSAEANLEFSLSPAFPRAFLRHGSTAGRPLPARPKPTRRRFFVRPDLAHLPARARTAGGCGRPGHLRPAGHERAAALRLLCLDPAAARFELFTYGEEDFVTRIDPHDHGNLDTRLEVCRRPRPTSWKPAAYHLAPRRRTGCQTRRARESARSRHRVRGNPRRRVALRSGERRPAREHEIERLVEELNRARSPETEDRGHPLYRQSPEAGWNPKRARRSRRWTPRSCATPSTIRCRPSPGANEASWTCWPPTAPAA